MTSPAEWLYGITPVEEALRAGHRHFRQLWIAADSDRARPIQELANERGLRISEVTRAELDRRLRGANHQGVALDCGALPIHGFRELLDAPADGVVLALDQVEDPQNFGALVRTAAFVGARGVLVHRSRRAPMSPAASKASAGTLEWFDLFECGNLADALQRFDRAGWRILGSALDDSAVPATRIEPGGPSILVMGNEGRGLRPLTLKRCTELVMIPRNGRAESLNVNVAAGILLARLTGSI